MQNEWRYILNSGNCHIDLDGEVIQDENMVEPFEGADGHRMVELVLKTDKYDRYREEWIYRPQEVHVWGLMIRAWFSKWPMGAEPYFIDGDVFNCSANNLRAWIPDLRTGQMRVVEAREESWGYVFDKRLRGSVEILETGMRFPSPSEAAKAVGGTKSGVSLVLSGRLETHCGFHFGWA